MFESLASCFAAYKPFFEWWKSSRLRGFAFCCSASLNMTKEANWRLQKLAKASPSAESTPLQIACLVEQKIQHSAAAITHESPWAGIDEIG